MFPSFVKRATNIPSSGIHFMMSYAAKHTDVISLGQGTPYFPTPSFIYDEVMKRAAHDPAVGMYSDEKIENELKVLIKKQCVSHYGFEPNVEEIVLTIGGVGALTAALLAFIEPGDEIIFFDPSYPIHLSQIHLAQGIPVFVPYDETSEWKFPLEKIRAAITKKTKAIILTNPNNPTGTVLTEEEVRKLSEIILENNLLLILDEAYEYLSYEKKVFSPMRIPLLRQNCILAKSFSKEYAMTGWRVGFAIAPQKIAQKLKEIHTYCAISVPTPSIVAAITALSDPRGETFIKETHEIYSKSRDAISERLAKLHNLFSFHIPEGAYYMFPKLIPDIDAKQFAMELVDEVKVITIPGDAMGPTGKNHLRLCFSLPPDHIHTAFDRIDMFAKAHGYL